LCGPAAHWRRRLTMRTRFSAGVYAMRDTGATARTLGRRSAHHPRLEPHYRDYQRLPGSGSLPEVSASLPKSRRVSRSLSDSRRVSASLRSFRTVSSPTRSLPQPLVPLPIFFAQWRPVGHVGLS
jgi:hypothetical protein